MTGEWKEEGEEDYEKKKEKGPLRDAEFPSTSFHCQDWKLNGEIYDLLQRMEPADFILHL